MMALMTERGAVRESAKEAMSDLASSTTSAMAPMGESSLSVRAMVLAPRDLA